ncbi:smpA / OmlA family protein [Methyloversatilis sp. RAC08]|mgnify:FL=1|uniref:outer membrane protein assembly factor BamE n=1 Tax=Methyloversatilis sp. RAC08 TaxID=1842540 RepID=UPI000858A1E7|nr:outer membrane protein assembly factor BamE [Methyloversatilis sp. RAC08]AOF80879.1 smpA / OmlA family protein [Methyloversatilis sp. RAC08]
MSFAPVVVVRYVLAALLPVLAGCTNVPSTLDVTNRLNPFRIDIRQGNLVTQEMAFQLKPGMSRDQVRFVLGSPMLADVFHPDRWDYLYYFKPGNKPEDTQQRRLIVYFEDDKLVSLGGDVVGAEEADLNQPEAPRTRTIDLGEVVAPK